LRETLDIASEFQDTRKPKLRRPANDSVYDTVPSL
jgi:hypothetical protein